jgi:hypothetical protein
MLELCDHEPPSRKAPEEGPPDEGVFIDNPLGSVGIQNGEYKRGARRERVQKGNDRGQLHLSEEQEKFRKGKGRGGEEDRLTVKTAVLTVKSQDLNQKDLR